MPERKSRAAEKGLRGVGGVDASVGLESGSVLARGIIRHCEQVDWTEIEGRKEGLKGEVERGRVVVKASCGKERCFMMVRRGEGMIEGRGVFEERRR